MGVILKSGELRTGEPGLGISCCFGEENGRRPCNAAALTPSSGSVAKTAFPDHQEKKSFARSSLSKKFRLLGETKKKSSKILPPTFLYISSLHTNIFYITKYHHLLWTSLMIIKCFLLFSGHRPCDLYSWVPGLPFGATQFSLLFHLTALQIFENSFSSPLQLIFLRPTHVVPSTAPSLTQFPDSSVPVAPLWRHSNFSTAPGDILTAKTSTQCLRCGPTALGAVGLAPPSSWTLLLWIHAPLSRLTKWWTKSWDFSCLDSSHMRQLHVFFTLHVAMKHFLFLDRT